MVCPFPLIHMYGAVVVIYIKIQTNLSIVIVNSIGYITFIGCGSLFPNFPVIY